MLLLLAAAAAPIAVAGISLADVGADSEVVFLEQNPYGAYHRYEVSLSIRGGQARLRLNQDGETVDVAVPLAECLGLWQKLLDTGVDELANAPTGNLPPDQSLFTVAVRSGATRHQFKAYGVDWQADPRYRAVVTEILATADARLAQARAARGKEE